MIKVNDSREYVENVVNPPQKPVFESRTRFCGQLYRLANRVKRPMRKDPMILIRNVIKGNFILSGKSPSEYRQRVPTIPPMDTATNDRRSGLK